MAFLSDPIEAAALPQSTRNFEPLPAGWYLATITSAELMTTKAGTGQYIKVRYDILGPTHQGRVVFGNLNIRNPSAKAEEIGLQQLGELMGAVGLSRLTDTDQLVGATRPRLRVAPLRPLRRPLRRLGRRLRLPPPLRVGARRLGLASSLATGKKTPAFAGGPGQEATTRGGCRYEAARKS